MDQENATRLSQEMANLVASFAANEEHFRPEPGRMQAFQAAAFEQIYEFIPDDTVATVVADSGSAGLPMLLAVGGGQLYKLVFGEVDVRGDDVPVTVCEKIPVGPDRGSISVATQYFATPVGRGRHTTWTFEFGLGFNSLHVESTYNSEQPGGESNENFATALASALGWDISESTP